MVEVCLTKGTAKRHEPRQLRLGPPSQGREPATMGPNDQVEVHAAVDTLGHLLAFHATAEDEQDRVVQCGSKLHLRTRGTSRRETEYGSRWVKLTHTKRGMSGLATPIARGNELRLGSSPPALGTRLGSDRQWVCTSPSPASCPLTGTPSWAGS